MLSQLPARLGIKFVGGEVAAFAAVLDAGKEQRAVVTDPVVAEKRLRTAKLAVEQLPEPSPTDLRTRAGKSLYRPPWVDVCGLLYARLYAHPVAHGSDFAEGNPGLRHAPGAWVDAEEQRAYRLGAIAFEIFQVRCARIFERVVDQDIGFGWNDGIAGIRERDCYSVQLVEQGFFSGSHVGIPLCWFGSIWQQRGLTMLGNMMADQLLISNIIEHASAYHGNREIVTRTVEGPIHRYTYRDAAVRVHRIANALVCLGVGEGDRIGTLAWNTHRHFELYFAISGLGAVMHTMNPRLFPEQIIYIANHAEDQWLCLDTTFVPLLEPIADQLRSIRGYILMTDAEHMPETSLPNALCYEDLLAAEDNELNWPQFDEQRAASLCYTSGTTGDPKGVLYSHRSTVLHAMAASAPDAIGVSCCNRILPVVPMFHVNAWGVPYAAAMQGAGMVFPGPRLDGEGIWQLVDAEQVDLLLGVPTVWLQLLQHMDSIGRKLESVDKVIVGGSAAPQSMIREFHEKHDAFLLHAWGMTEMSPLGTLCSETPEMRVLGDDERYALQSKQGRATFGVHQKIVDETGAELPWDGTSFGRLMVRGPWIVDRYFRANTSALEEGWFDTGDVSTIDSDGCMQIVDRSKDVIKSGGEWISSIDLENAAVDHPGVAEACVIGVRHHKWDERPLLLVIPADDAPPERQEILTFLAERVAKWWLPDAIVFVDELPHTATGKLHKVPLREQYMDYLVAGEGE